jgi:hypothetical protein
MNKSAACISHGPSWICRYRALTWELTVEMHDLLVTPRRLMGVEMRDAKELPLLARFVRALEDQALQVFRGIGQSIESVLVLRLRNGCSVKVNVCSEERRPC